MARMKGKETESLIEEVEDMGTEPRVYELGFHLDPELPLDEVKKEHKAIRSLVSGAGSIVAEIEPEKIQLAYTISRQEVTGRRDFDTAYFAWIVYETLPAKHAEILSAMQANKHIVRFIDLLTMKEIARHALETHELREKMPEVEQDAEAVLGAELDAVLESSTI